MWLSLKKGKKWTKEKTIKKKNKTKKQTEQQNKQNQQQHIMAPGYITDGNVIKHKRHSDI